jgi:hypothetical protein
MLNRVSVYAYNVSYISLVGVGIPITIIPRGMDLTQQASTTGVLTVGETLLDWNVEIGYSPLYVLLLIRYRIVG